MRLHRAEILLVGIPFRFTFRHAKAARAESASVIVRLESDSGVSGYGESAPRDYVTGENTESAVGTLERTLLPPLGATTFDEFEDVLGAIDAMLGALPRAAHAAWCAAELALLDLAGREFGFEAGSVLGPVVNDPVRYDGVVSADGAVAVRAIVSDMLKLGFPGIKVKIGGGDLASDVATLAAAREVLGPDIALRVDANGAWTVAEALRRIVAFRPFDLCGIEQPVPAADLDGMAAVTAATEVPVIADESVVTAEDACRLVAAQGCDVFNLRISKNGGLWNTLRLREIAARGGLTCMMGAQVGETAILTAAGRQFATRSRDLRHLEGSYGTLLLASDIADAEVTLGAGGGAPALRGPGLGISVDPTRLAPFVRTRRVLEFDR